MTEHGSMIIGTCNPFPCLTNETPRAVACLCWRGCKRSLQLLVGGSAWSLSRCGSGVCHHHVMPNVIRVTAAFATVACTWQVPVMSVNRVRAEWVSWLYKHSVGQGGRRQASSWFGRKREWMHLQHAIDAVETAGTSASREQCTQPGAASGRDSDSAQEARKPGSQHQQQRPTDGGRTASTRTAATAWQGIGLSVLTRAAAAARAALGRATQ